MKTIKLITVLLAIVSIYSCNEPSPIETKKVNVVAKKIDMNDVGNNYASIALEIQSLSDLDFVIGDFKLKMRGMKPAEGMNVDNTVILEGERGNRAIIIDNNTQSIYVRYTDIDHKYNYTLFGFKNANDLGNLLTSDEYDFESIKNSDSYKNRLNTSLTVDFTSTKNSFIIRKPILTTKEEFAHARENSNSDVTCDVKTTPSNTDNTDNTEEKLFRGSSSLYRTTRTWNIVVYKRWRWINTSRILDAVNSSFKSLSVPENTNYYYSRYMYSNVHVTYRQAPGHIYNSASQTCLDNFTTYLSNNSVPANRTTHSYLYLTSSSGFADMNGRGGPKASGSTYRAGVSRNVASTFAHELGHTLGAAHCNGLFWDSSLGLFGWVGESLMHAVSGGTSGWAEQQWKYYHGKNRDLVRHSLRHLL